MQSFYKQLSDLLKLQRSTAFILWVVFFCYSICAALIFQHIILPHLSSMQSGSGMINNDANYFDLVATTLAKNIQDHGWSNWTLYPEEGAPGNVAILGALYALFGHDPSLVIPINAAIHALGGVMIYMLAREISNTKYAGMYAGIIAATLFVIFPSTLTWYGQNHKDTYAITGVLLTLLVWMKALKSPPNMQDWLSLAVVSFIAVILVGMVRPFLLKLLLIFGAVILMVIVTSNILGRSRNLIKPSIFFLFFLLCLLAGIHFAKVLGGQQADATYEKWQDNTQKVDQGWYWSSTSWMPSGIENYIESAARTRAGLISYGEDVKAKSMIDEDIAPRNIYEVVTYLPRAYQVALFAPFPSSWFEIKSITRMASAAEMIVYYFSLPGLLILLYHNRKPPVILAIAFSSFFLLIYGFTQANLGTLYRYRYAYTSILLMLGVLGWVTWLEQSGRLKRLISGSQPLAIIESSENPAQKLHPDARKQVISSGIIVLGLTLLTFLGFFVRDILMAKRFGLSPVLDSFFIALMAPMFLVTVLCMPLGAAIVPIYTGLKEKLDIKNARSLITGASFWITLVSLVICVLLHFSGQVLLPRLYLGGSILNTPDLFLLWDMALLILLFSGTVIVGNSVLNANGLSTYSGMAQLVVPLTAIFAIWVEGGYGVKAIMLGMVVGQILNLIIIQVRVRTLGLSLFPRYDAEHTAEKSELLSQYIPLMTSAFFIAVAALVSTLLATSLPEGGVSAFNLGNKVVLFLTGLLSIAVSSVILPYFSAMVAKNHIISARRELSFFLLFSTFTSVPVSACMYIWSEPLIQLMFEGGTFDRSSTVLVAKVLQYGLIQIPFFVSSSFLLKFATATKHLLAVTLTALLGLVVNIVGSIFFMKHMGVTGIALGSSVSVIFSAVLLVLILVRYWHISKFDALILFLNWLLFITLLICLHFQSTASVYIIIFAYLVLISAYLSIQREQLASEQLA